MVERPHADVQVEDGVFINGFRVAGFSGFDEPAKWYTFPRGPFKISGRMGAGKTSTARLILFGIVGDVKIVEDYLAGDTGVVELELANPSSSELRLIRVIRRVSRSPDGAVYVESRVVNPETGEILAEGRDVEAFLENFTGETVLGNIKDVFILRGDLEKSYQQLKEKVRSLTYLDLLEQLRSDIESLRTSLKMRLEELESEVTSFEEYLSEEGVPSPSRGGSLSEYVSQLKAAFLGLTSKLAREAGELREKIISMEKEQLSLSARIEELEAKKSSLENLANSIRVKEEQVDLMRKTFEDVARRVAQLEKEVELLKGDLKRAEERVRSAEEEIVSLSRKMEVVDAELSKETPLEDKGVYIEREKQLVEAISRLKPELENLREQLRVKEFNLNKDMISLQRIVNSYASLRAKVAELPEQISDTMSLVSLRERLSDELERSVKPFIGSLSSEARFLRDFKCWLEKKGFCPLCHAETVNLSREVKELESHIGEIERKLRSLQFRQKELQDILREVDKAIELQRSYVELSASVKSKELEVNELRRRVQEAEEELKTYELRLDAVRMKLRGLDEAAKELEKERFKLRSELEKAKRERDEGLRVIESLRARIVSAEAQLADMREKAAKMRKDLEEEERKLESLKQQYATENYEEVKKEAAELKRKVSQIKASKKNLEDRIKELEVKAERFLTLSREIEKRESRVASVERCAKLADIVAGFLSRTEDNAKREFFNMLSKDLPKIGEILGIKDFHVDVGVLERLVLGRRVSQKIHTLSDGEFISLLSLISGLFGAWSGRKKKRFLVLDVPIDEETALNLANVLREMNCLQPGFIFSKPGPLTVEPL
ncbi:MAG: hypothetical protein QXX87_01260 [Candidatus Jordarchaeales archaeon]